MASGVLTVKERILLHLSEFSEVSPEEIYNVPFDLTQDGIASLAGISRAHASLELKKMEEALLVGNWLAHVKGSGSKRRAYYLLEQGLADVIGVKEKIKSAGLSVDTLLDMKKCDPNIMWDNLSDADKEVFGLVCVIRPPVLRKLLPETEISVIPTNYYGMIKIDDIVKNNYLSVIDRDKIKVWHSRAADWWLDNDNDIQERLYHLIKAGRILDACKLLIRESDKFLQNPNEDLLAIIVEIEPSERYKESVISLRANIALLCDNLDEAMICANIIETYPTNESDLIRSEIFIKRKMYDLAFEMAEPIFKARESPRAALISARALIGQGDFNKAASFLDSAYRILLDNGDATCMDDILILKAKIAFERGKEDEAYGYLSKALKACRGNSAHNNILSLIDGLKEHRFPNF